MINIFGKKDGSKTIKIGLCHSLTGTMSISEQNLLDVDLMAIDEINGRGGILECKIEPVVVDCVSDPGIFAREARKLLLAGIQNIFGCWTSASRKAVKPIVESMNGLLWYPVQYEGLEESRNIVYTGSCLNQQISPAIEWTLKNVGKTIFLVGSDYVFPKTANRLIRALAENSGGKIADERYAALGDNNFKDIVDAIKREQPDMILNTINGDSNIAFYRQYCFSGMKIPVLAVSVSETEVQNIIYAAEGHYACWNYFQSFDTPENKKFVADFKKRYGENRVCSAPMAMEYCQIYLWKQAVEKAKSFNAEEIKKHLVGCEFQGPAGKITIQPNHHVDMPAYIGKLAPDGQFETIWKTEAPIKPLPWLGIEESALPTKTVIKEAMAAYTETLFSDKEKEKETEEILHATKDRLQTQFHRMPIGCIVWDREFRVASWNPAAEKIFGFTPEETIGKHPFDFIVPEDVRPHVKTIWKCVLAGDAKTNSVNENTTKDGRKILCEWINVPIKKTDGSVIGGFSMVQDITACKKTEARAKELERLRKNIIEIIDGRLRTPIDVIRWNMDGILKGENGPINESQKKILHAVRQAGNNIDAILKEVWEMLG